MLLARVDRLASAQVFSHNSRIGGTQYYFGAVIPIDPLVNIHVCRGVSRRMLALFNDRGFVRGLACNELFALNRGWLDSWVVSI